MATDHQTGLLRMLAGALLAVATAAPAAAQQVTSDWRFGAALYGYFPRVSGTAVLPGRGATTIEADADTLLRNLEFGFMGSFEATKGRWGAFTDVMVFDVANSRTGTGTLTVSGIALPPGVSAHASLDIETTVWTLAGLYRALDTPEAAVAVLAGGRMLELRTELGWDFSHAFGPFVGPGRSGSSEARRTNWDAIVGVKGRLRFGGERRWFVPYYVDVGAGQSDRTWQATAGLGYAFDSGEAVVAWRHLDYRFAASDRMQDLAFNGPAVGVAIRW